MKTLHADDTHCSSTINNRAMAQAPPGINPPLRPLHDLVIKTRGLGKTYGGRKVAEALRGLDLSIPRINMHHFPCHSPPMRRLLPILCLTVAVLPPHFLRYRA